MNDLTGMKIEDLVPTGGDDLVQQLNDAAKRWPWALIIALVAVIGGLISLPFGLIVIVAAIPVVWWVHQWDQSRRNTVVFYDVTDAPAAWFGSLVATAEILAQSQKLWRLESSGQLATTHQRKVNAMAGSLVNRSAVSVDFDSPKHLITNVAVPTVTCGRNALYLLPDRILVRTKRSFSDVRYDQLRADVSMTRFIEAGPIPTDGVQVDTTWRYANVRGGPDRRFKDNRQIPVMQYGQLELSSWSGLHWVIQLSKPDAAGGLGSVLQHPPRLVAPAG